MLSSGVLDASTASKVSGESRGSRVGRGGTESASALACSSAGRKTEGWARRSWSGIWNSCWSWGQRCGLRA